MPAKDGEDRTVDEELEITEEDLSGPVIDRRTTMKLLGAAGMAGLAGLAGCSGGGEETPTEAQDGAGGGGDDTGSGGGDGTSTPGGESTESSGRSGERYGGRMSAAWNVAQIDNLDPHRSELTQFKFLFDNIFSGLTQVTQDFTLEGDVAADWTVSDGGETIEFELVEDATFHNGDSVTAEDVRYSLDRAANNDISVHQSKLAVLSDPVAEEGVTVDGDYSLTLNLDSPFAPIFMNLTCNVAPSGAIVPQDVIEEMGEDSYNLTPVGSGPFEVVNHELGNELVLDATDDWHQANDNGDPLPYLDGIDITPIQEPTTRVSAIRTGDVDFVSLIPAAQADTLEEASDVVLEERLGPNFGGLGFNSSLEPFTDQRVRMAVAKSIDAEQYVEETFLGYGEADTSIYNPVLGWVYRDEFGDDPDQKPEDQLHDPEGAVELAEEADAMDLELTMTVAQPELRGARVMRNMINDVLGWEIELNQQDYPTLFERAADGDILWMPWGNSTVPEPDLTVSADWGEEVATNWWGWFPDDHAEQVEAQRQATDREERKQILWEIEDRIIEEAPWALLEHQSALSARRPRLKNYFHYGPIKRFHTVYLEE